MVALVGLIGCFGIILVFFAFSISPILGVIVLVALIVWVFYSNQKTDEKREENKHQHRMTRQKGISNLEEINDFEITKMFVGNQFVSKMICINENNKKIAFIDRWR